MPITSGSAVRRGGGLVHDDRRLGQALAGWTTTGLGAWPTGALTVVIGASR